MIDIKRIAILGPQWVGKSKLTKSMANYYNTNFVEDYSKILRDFNNYKISIDDFIRISKSRQDIENWIINNSNKLLFCDTEDINIYTSSKIYFPDEYSKISSYFLNLLNLNKKYDLYLLLKPHISDSISEEKLEHYGIIKKELINTGCEFIEITGNLEEKIESTKFIITNRFNINIKKIYDVKD